MNFLTKRNLFRNDVDCSRPVFPLESFKFKIKIKMLTNQNRQSSIIIFRTFEFSNLLLEKAKTIFWKLDEKITIFPRIPIWTFPILLDKLYSYTQKFCVKSIQQPSLKVNIIFAILYVILWNQMLGFYIHWAVVILPNWQNKISYSDFLSCFCDAQCRKWDQALCCCWRVSHTFISLWQIPSFHGKKGILLFSFHFVTVFFHCWRQFSELVKCKKGTLLICLNIYIKCDMII